MCIGMQLQTHACTLHLIALSGVGYDGWVQLLRPLNFIAAAKRKIAQEWCDSTYTVRILFFSDNVEYAYVILPYVKRTLTSLYDENKLYVNYLQYNQSSQKSVAYWMCHCFSQTHTIRRSQAVARIADRTAPQ